MTETASERARRVNREREQRMVDRALSNPPQHVRESPHPVAPEVQAAVERVAGKQASRSPDKSDDERLLTSRGWQRMWKAAWGTDMATYWSKDGHVCPQFFAAWLERNSVNRAWWPA